MKAFFYAALLCGVAKSALADPPGCTVLRGGEGTYDKPVCMQLNPAPTNDADDVLYTVDRFKYRFSPLVGDKYRTGVWRSVPKSGEVIPGDGHCDNGVVVRQSGQLMVVGFNKEGQVLCEFSEEYIITSPAPRPRWSGVVTMTATPPVVPLDAAMLAEELAKLGTEVNRHTDERVGELRNDFNARFDQMQMSTAQAATDRLQNTQLAALVNRTNMLASGALMAPTEADQSALFSMGVEGISFDELGSGLVGVVAVESNRPNTRWSPVLRVTAGVLNDGQENRGMLGADVGVFRPVLRGGYLNLGVLAGWRGVLSQTRLADYPHAGLAARYRVASWCSLEGRMLFGALSDEQTGDTSGGDAPDLDMAGAVAAMLTF